MAKQLTFYEDESIVIAAIAAKGGSGKTSLVTNLAGVVANSGKRELLVDLDSQADISTTFDLKKSTFTAYSMFEGRMPSEDLTSKYNAFIDVIQSHEDIATIELDLLPRLKNYGDPFNFVKKHIDQLRHKYNYVWVDAPPNFGLIVGNVIAAADYAIIPFVPEPYGIKGLKRAVNAVKDFHKMGSKVRVLAVVPMFIESRTVVHTQLLEDARRYCLEAGIYMTETVIPHSIRFAASTAFEKVPATMGKEKNNYIVKQYNYLWDELSHILQFNATRSV